MQTQTLGLINGGSTTAVNPVAAQAQTATTKLNLNEVQLDADSNVSADEASLRRILKIQQDLTGVMKATDPNSWINSLYSRSNSNFSLLTSTPSNAEGKKAYEDLITADYNKKKGTAAFRAYFYVDYEQLKGSAAAKEYYDSFKLTEPQKEAKMKELAQPTLTFLQDLTNEDWVALKEASISSDNPQGYISKPTDLADWKVEEKIDEILTLGQAILGSASVYGDKEGKYIKLIHTMVPNPSTVEALNNKFKNLDIGKMNFAAKKELIEKLSTEELITIVHGYTKYIYDVKQSSDARGMINNFLNKEILIAEVANSDFATTYYLEAIKASVNSITPPAAVNANASTAPSSSTPANTPPTVTVRSNTKALTNTDEPSRTLVIRSNGSELKAEDQETKDPNKLIYKLGPIKGGKLFIGGFSIAGNTGSTYVEITEGNSFTQDDISNSQKDIKFIWDGTTTDKVGFNFTVKNEKGVETEVKRFEVKVEKTPSAAASPSPVAPTNAPQATGDPKVVDLQKLLAKRGFYNGKADGVLTTETRNATIRAQNFYTISPADGSSSPALIDKLNSDTFVSNEAGSN